MSNTNSSSLEIIQTISNKNKSLRILKHYNKEEKKFETLVEIVNFISFKEWTESDRKSEILSCDKMVDCLKMLENSVTAAVENVEMNGSIVEKETINPKMTNLQCNSNSLSSFSGANINSSDPNKIEFSDQLNESKIIVFPTERNNNQTNNQMVENLPNLGINNIRNLLFFKEKKFCQLFRSFAFYNLMLTDHYYINLKNLPIRSLTDTNVFHQRNESIVMKSIINKHFSSLKNNINQNITHVIESCDHSVNHIDNNNKNKTYENLLTCIPSNSQQQERIKWINNVSATEKRIQLAKSLESSKILQKKNQLF